MSAGTTLEVADTTRNIGPGAAGPSTLAPAYLCTYPGKGAGDVLLTPDRAVPASPADDQSRSPGTVTIPASTPPAIYYVLAKASTGAD